MADEPIADVVARALYQRERTTRQLVADCNILAREVQRSNEAEERYLRRGLELTADKIRLRDGIEEAWVIMFGDEHLLSASPAGDICESCGEGWPCTVVEWGAMYREAGDG